MSMKIVSSSTCTCNIKFYFLFRVSESSLGDPVPEVPQEDSSDSNTVSYIPMHEDISPQKEEVKATDDEEVDEIRLEVCALGLKPDCIWFS